MRDRLVKVVVAASFASLGTACTMREPGGAERAGRDAGPTAGPFACTGDRCVQRYPRFPDDGEWTCSETAGVAVCSGGEPPAGSPFNMVDRAWTCGLLNARAGKPSKGERVCVNYTPDFPDGAARGWRCSYIAEQSIARVCERDPTAHVIGDRCDARGPCLDGLRCVDARCTAELPPPSCVIDGDCHQAVCRFGSCLRDPT